MRAALLVLVACSTQASVVARREARGVTISNADLVRAAHARWGGDPDASAKIVARANDPDGLAELGRAELARGRLGAARHAFERAAGEPGHWQWRTNPYLIVAHAFTRDGRWLASCDNEGRVDVYDFASLQRVRSFATGTLPRVFVLSDDGRWVGLGKDTTQVWDLQTGALVADLPYATPFVFAPDNRLIVAASAGGLVEVDVTRKQELRKTAGPTLAHLAVHGDRYYGSDEATVHVYDTTLTEVATSTRTAKVDAIAVGDALVLATAHGLAIGDATVPGRYYEIAARGTQVAASSGGDTNIYTNGTLAHRLSTGRNAATLAFHPLGGLVVASGYDGMDLWNTMTGRYITAIAREPAGARALAFDAKGERLAVGSARGHVTVWSLVTGAATSWTVRPGTLVDHVAFGPGGELAMSSTDNNIDHRGTSKLVLYDARGALRWSQDLPYIGFLGFRPGTSAVTAVTGLEQPDGTRKHAAVLWSLAGTRERVIDLVTSRGYHWSADGSAFLGSTNVELVAAPLDGRVPTRIALPHHASAISPDGTRLAGTHDDGRIAIWDLATRRPSRVLYDDNGDIAATAWTPDGKTLVDAAHDTATLWDPDTGAKIAALVGPSPIVSLAMHPGGRMFATGHDDGRVTLWSLDSRAAIATLTAPGELAAFVTTPDGAIDGTPTDDAVAWAAGDRLLPVASAFPRHRVPGLLPARIAARARTAAPPRPRIAPPAPLPRCHPGVEYGQQGLHATVEGIGRLRMCLDYTYRIPNRSTMRPPPLCFLLDLATGTYAPVAPTPGEAIGFSDEDRASASLDGNIVHVCRGDTCREIAVRTLDGDGASAYVDDAMRTLAVAHQLSGVEREAVLVYDVATGKRIAQFIAQGSGMTYSFLDGTLMATSTPCAGPCSSSTLFDARKGTKLGGIAVNTSAVTPAQLDGDIWAFNDWDTTNVVLHDIKTGAVAGTIKLPRRACTDEPEPETGSEFVMCDGLTLLSDQKRLLVLPSTHPGDVLVFDRKGKLLAEHHLPICQ